MDVRNFLAAVKTFLIVVSKSRWVIFVILCPIVVVAIGLFKVVSLFLNESTLVLTTRMDMPVLVFRLVLRFMGMPGIEEITSTTGMGTAPCLITAPAGLAGTDLYRLEHLRVKIVFACAGDIEMFLLRICSTINIIVTTIESALIFFFIM